MKNALIILILILLIGAGVFAAMRFFGDTVTVDNEQDAPEVTTDVPSDLPVDSIDEATTTDETTDTEEAFREGETVIGTSVEGRPITAYHYGSGEDELLFIGGIHGGYEWNTALVAYELMDYLETGTDLIPENVKVTVIPVLNPDGLHEVVGSAGRFSVTDVPADQADTIPGRFNANGVDLNRNFDCQWQPTGMWREREVDGGSEPFSEPESRAIRNYIEEGEPEAVVTYYSAAGGVFASNCGNGVPAETLAITQLYSEAANYPSYEEFDFYEITGDMVNWFAKQGIPAISVLLTTHEDVEWDKNRVGVAALLEYYAD